MLVGRNGERARPKFVETSLQRNLRFQTNYGLEMKCSKVEFERGRRSTFENADLADRGDVEERRSSGPVTLQIRTQRSILGAIHNAKLWIGL